MSEPQTTDELSEALDEVTVPAEPKLLVTDIEARGLSVGPGADLSGEDLSYAQMGWRNLKGADLSGCTALKSVLTRAILAGANLSNGVFTDSDMYGARFQGCRAEHTVFDNCVLNQALFEDSVMVGASFKGTTLEDCEFMNADLRGVSFAGAHIEFTNFSGARMDGADFVGAMLKKVVFDTADPDYENVDLHQAIWLDETEEPPADWMLGHDGTLRRSFEYIISRSARPDLNAEAARMLYDEHPELGERDMLILLGSLGR